jgi:phosphoglycerate kinase
MISDIMPVQVSDLLIGTLDDDFPSNKKIALRVDFNSPVDKKTKRIIDDSRLKAHVETVSELVKSGNSVVLLSHQGRPGDEDFISLEQHASIFSKISGLKVEFIDDVIGPAARERIKKMGKGEIVALENVRMVSEELIEGPPEKQANTFIIKKLSPLFDYFVNDAFATAHRGQPSVVGFPPVIKSLAGRLMQKEITALAKTYDPNTSPKLFILGGGKVQDAVKILENIVRRRNADRILTGGLLSVLIAAAKGLDIGKENLKLLEELGLLSLIPRVRKILMLGAPIEIPVDFKAIDEKNEVKEFASSRVKGLIRDIGESTINMYLEFIKESKLIVFRGPMGVVEDERFRKGTEALIKASIESGAHVIIGGGHTISAIGMKDEDLPKSRIHVSTGGGALLLFLAGEKLPALESLHLSYVKFYGGKK